MSHIYVNMYAKYMYPNMSKFIVMYVCMCMYVYIYSKARFKKKMIDSVSVEELDWSA